MSQFKNLSPLFKEFGLPVLDEFLKKQAETKQVQEDEEVVEIVEPKEKIVVQIKDETSKV